MPTDPQIFTTKSLPNSQSVLYTLAICSPGLLGAPLTTYTFPLSPQAIRKSRRARTTVYNTQGPVGSQGVTRIADVYGLEPPSFSLMGTTGWKYHGTDGMSLSGYESALALQSLLAQYAQLNAAQTLTAGYASQAGQAVGSYIGNAIGGAAGAAQGGQIGGAVGASIGTFTLEYHDYFADEYWIVEPVGEQIFRQTSTKPLLFYYEFHWDAIQAVSNPIFQGLDLLSSALDIPEVTQANTLLQGLGNTLSIYGLNGRSA
jgi:hypothetical protein